MTMLVDTRKDNYDELLVLARDARSSRARVNRWTTGLVLGSMFAGGAYVATTNQQVDELRESTQTAQQQRDAIQSEYVGLLDERNRMKSQMETLQRYEERYAELTPALILGDRIKDIGLPVAPNPDGKSQFAVSNLVWLVDGSRRFPLTGGDILWIPEDEFWIRVEPREVNETGEVAENQESGEAIEKTPTKPNRITIHRGERPIQSTTSKEEYVFKKDSDVFRIDVPVASVPRGVADCIRLTYHKDSTRLGFTGEEYIDIEVLFYSNPACPNPLPAPQTQTVPPTD